MKVIGLISGGKDSFYNLMQCVANGHEVVALANLRPRVEEKKDELDSYMYQTVGHDAIHLYEECMGLPLYRREIHGSALQQGSDYVKTEKDETEDLYELLKMAKEHHPDLQAVSVGAILSNYQRVRVENVCSRLGLVSLSYLWQRNQEELLWEMAQAGVNAVLVKVAAIGLKKQHLGRSIGDMYPYFCRMNQEYDLHICGEGGEYETLTIDCPLFRKRIVIKETEIVIHSDDAFAQVAYLRFKQLEVEEKDEDEINQDWIAEMNLSPQWDADNIMQPIESHVLLQEELSKAAATTSATAETTPSIILHEWEKNANLWTHAEEALAMSGMRQPMFKISSDNVVCAIGGTHAYETDHDRHLSIAEETSACLDNVIAKLSKAGLSWQEVVFMQVYVSDMANFGVVNNAYKGYFGINPPPRACVGARLPGKRRIQVSCLAIRKENNINGARQTMHVQGMSYWAPANIGPYSQATTHSHHTFIAGQIGMIPSTLDLPVPKSLAKEVAWSLRNLKQIAVVQQADLQHRTALCIAFVDHPEALSPVMSAWSSLMADKTAPPPLLGVCMPSLPKGAQVEWQVLIHDGKVYADREAKQVADGDGYDTDDDDAYQLEKRALKPVVMELHHEMAAGPRNSQENDNSHPAAGATTGLAAPLLLSSSHGRQWIRDMLGMLATAVDRVLEQHRTPARGPGLQRPGWGDVVNVTVYYLQDIILGKDVTTNEKLRDEGAGMDDEAVRADLLEAMVDDTLSCIAGIEHRQHGQQGVKPHPGAFAVTLVPVRAMSDHGLLAMTVHAVSKIPTRPGLHS
ncbi:ATP binding domain 4 [Actinomortierella wolfii]|nr:ATP binding domain 4 [Actinomortierella wolfii]